MTQRESHARPLLPRQRAVQGRPHAPLTPEQIRALHKRVQDNKARCVMLANKFQQAVAQYRFFQQWTQEQRAYYRENLLS